MYVYAVRISMKKSTRVNHPERVILPEDNLPLTSPVYNAVKYELPSLEELQKLTTQQREGFSYSRLSNPGVSELENSLAQLQECEAAVAVSSGMSAVTTALLSLTRQGDHIVTFIESYKPARLFMKNVLSRYGVTCSVISIDDNESLEKILSTQDVRLVYFESPTNPVNKIADIRHICKLAHANDALVVLDNTVAGLHMHCQFEIDYYIHSLTKYASGHGDVMGGAILGSKSNIKKVHADAALFGPVLDPQAAFLIARGLKTYFVRFERQNQNAMQIAQFLDQHEKVVNTFYPGLSSDDYHDLANSQMTDFGTIVSFDIAGDEKNLHRFIDALKLFKLVFSLGSTESLVSPPGMFNVGDLNEEERLIARISPTSVRLAIGIEDADDLIEDIDKAFSVAYN
jgi:cystathionine beta-lyase/cystathionine gamma-synthase